MGSDTLDPNYRSNIDFWILLMVGTAFVAGISMFAGKYFFAKIGQNITINVRKNLYGAILEKHIGWHDERTNGSALMTAILARDVDKLDAVASEASAIAMEAAFAVLVGLTFGFVYCW